MSCITAFGRVMYKLRPPYDVRDEEHAVYPYQCIVDGKEAFVLGPDTFAFENGDYVMWRGAKYVRER